MEIDLENNTRANKKNARLGILEWNYLYVLAGERQLSCSDV